MLWSEFVKGTGCKQTENNYKVYERLEVMYMNTDMSKAEVYDYGKKLVDNSLTEEEYMHNLHIESIIQHVKEELDKVKSQIEFWKDWPGEKMYCKGLRAERNRLTAELKMLKQSIIKEL